MHVLGSGARGDADFFNNGAKKNAKVNNPQI
jgi:hypothetical protein